MMKNLEPKVLLATVVLITAACSPISSTPDEAGSNAEIASPLEPYLASVWGTGLSQEEQIAVAEARNVFEENYIAQCMRDAGFEYTPFPEGTTFRFGDAENWQPEDREWVAQHGFGMFFEGTRPDSMVTSLTIDGDPNRAHQESLSAAEAKAWQEALEGRWADFNDGTFVFEDGTTMDFDEWMEYRSTNSCRGRAWSATQENSPVALAQTEEFAPLFDAINQLRDVQRATATDADREWSICMANAGHPDLGTQWDAQNLVQERSSAFWDDWTWEERGHPDRDPEMIAIRELEIELALADFDCRAETDFDARQAAHRLELETQFVNDHRAALEALRAAAEQLG